MSAREEVPPSREPPWSPESEQALVGSLLQDNGVMALVADLVDVGSFFDHANRLVFGALADLLAARQAGPDTATTPSRKNTAAPPSM